VKPLAAEPAHANQGERIEVRGCDFYTFRDGVNNSSWKTPC
jgi:hypothetical protein